ncbi:MAG: hypothetical protein WCY05_05650 [Candidatus Omnitrophota bacterium]
MILVVDYNLKDITITAFKKKQKEAYLESCIKDVSGISDDETLKKRILSIAGKENIEAISFRILFGGDYFDKPAFIDANFFLQFEKLTELFPFYVPLTMAILKRFQKIFKNTPLMAFFETSFFLNLPNEEKYYALPFEYCRANKIKKWGFHGILHQASVQMFASGSKNVSIVFDKQTTVSAIYDKKPLSISLGYTPLEGVMSRASCGDLDPGIVFYLMNVHKFSIFEIDEMLKSKSGFLGLTGYDIELNEMLKLHGKDSKVDLAFDVYRAQIMKHIGEGIAVLGGLDNIIFSGSNMASFVPVIHDIIKKISFLGINTISLPWQSDKKIIDITSSDSKIKAYLNKISVAEAIFYASRQQLKTLA